MNTRQLHCVDNACKHSEVKQLTYSWTCNCSHKNRNKSVPLRIPTLSVPLSIQTLCSQYSTNLCKLGSKKVFTFGSLSPLPVLQSRPPSPIRLNKKHYTTHFLFSRVGILPYTVSNTCMLTWNIRLQLKSQSQAMTVNKHQPKNIGPFMTVQPNLNIQNQGHFNNINFSL